MLCDQQGIPCVVVCGRNESGHTHNVYELAAHFPIDQCMREAAACLASLLEENISSFPVLENLG
jgi:hypothetical protein